MRHRISKLAMMTCLLLLLALHQTSADSVTDGTELLLSFMVHRHGDRTPSQSTKSYVNVTKSLEQAIAPWGYGQLTNKGRMTGYKIGLFIRRRYDELLSKTYNMSEIYIRSTDSTRTKMTVLSAMAAVYPAVGDTWSDDINWVPVPYTTVPAKTDFNLANINCPVLETAYKSLMKTPSTRMEEYKDVIDKLSIISGRNMTTAPIEIFMSYHLYVSEISMGMKLGDEIMALMPRLEEAASVAMDIMLGDETNSALQAGVLLNEFIDAASSVIAGKDVQKVRVYSAHDINVYSLQAVTGVNRQGVPKYGSLFSLELRKTATGKYVVVPVYLPSPDENEIYLSVKNCGGAGDSLCDFDTFNSLTSNNVLDEDEWRTACEWSPDLTFDTSSID